MAIPVLCVRARLLIRVQSHGYFLQDIIEINNKTRHNAMRAHISWVIPMFLKGLWLAGIWGGEKPSLTNRTLTTNYNVIILTPPIFLLMIKIICIISKFPKENINFAFEYYFCTLDWVDPIATLTLETRGQFELFWWMGARGIYWDSSRESWPSHLSRVLDKDTRVTFLLYLVNLILF